MYSRKKKNFLLNVTVRVKQMFTLDGFRMKELLEKEKLISNFGHGELEVEKANEKSQNFTVTFAGSEVTALVNH